MWKRDRDKVRLRALAVNKDSFRRSMSVWRTRWNTGAL